MCYVGPLSSPTRWNGERLSQWSSQPKLRGSGNRKSRNFPRQETPVVKEQDTPGERGGAKRHRRWGAGAGSTCTGTNNREIHDPRVSGKILRGIGQATITDSASGCQGPVKMRGENAANFEPGIGGLGRYRLVRPKRGKSQNRILPWISHHWSCSHPLQGSRRSSRLCLGVCRPLLPPAQYPLLEVRDRITSSVSLRNVSADTVHHSDPDHPGAIGSAEDFLKSIGRSAETKVKAEEWDALWKLDGSELKKQGLGVKDRR